MLVALDPQSMHESLLSRTILSKLQVRHVFDALMPLAPGLGGKVLPTEHQSRQHCRPVVNTAMAPQNDMLGPGR